MLTDRESEGRASLEALAKRPAVVTIDLHRGHLDPSVATLALPDDKARAVVAQSVELLDEFRRMQVAIIHVVTSYRSTDEILSNRYWSRQAKRGDGSRGNIAAHNLEGMPGLELMPGVAGPGDAIVATKKRYDCFVGTDLQMVLEAGGHDSLLLMGVNTNSCVIATALSASVRDYAVFVIREAVDTMMGDELHDAALAIIGASFGWVVDGSTAVEALASRNASERAG
jgi:nicotinamidase-related amidase